MKYIFIVSVGFVFGYIHVLSSMSYAQNTHVYCVRCMLPEQTYRCQVKTSFANMNRSTGQLHCIVNIAKDKNHESCQIQSRTQSQCNGFDITYNYTGVTPLQRPETRQASPGQSQPEFTEGANRGLHAENKKEQDAAPDTLVDLTNNAIDKTQQGLRNTGDAITNAAKTTYECLASLFSDC